MTTKCAPLVWEFLKSHEWVSIDEIYSYVSEKITSPEKITLDDVSAYIDGMVRSGIIVERCGLYKIGIVLEPPSTWKRLPETQHFTWKQRKALAGSGPIEKPPYKESKYKEYYPWYDQSVRPTCVGHAVSLLMLCNYFNMTGKLPTKEDLAEFKRNVDLTVPGCRGRLVYDKHHYISFSPQWIYTISRIVANLPDGVEGSYIDAAMDAMRHYGAITFEDGCLTGKTYECAPKMFPKHGSDSETLAYYKGLASRHRLSGAITGANFDDACDMIDKYGCIVCAVQIYSNYTSGGKKGLYPRIGRAKPIGWHAQFSDSYSREKREIYFWQTWGDSWSHDGGYHADDFDVAVGGILAPIDDTEFEIVRGAYCRTVLKSNAPVTFFVDGQSRASMSTEFTLMVPLGETHTIFAIPSNKLLWVEDKLTHTVKLDKTEYLVEFKFTRKSITPPPLPPPPVPPVPPVPPSPPNNTNNILDRIKELFKKYKFFNWFFGSESAAL